MSRKIAIYGGAFNPVHVDHINLAKGLIDCGYVDRVYLMPCFEHFHGKEMLNFFARFALLEEACKEVNAQGYEIFPLDVENTVRNNGSLYDLVHKVDFSELGEECYFVIGEDNANKIASWKEWRWLIENIRFAVVKRVGYSPSSLFDWFTKSETHKYIDLSDRVASCSSSHVRSIIKAEGLNSKKLRGLLPHSVLTEIQLSNYYV